MEIVVTNDDGIEAPGIFALARAVKDLGNTTVIAPDKNWSASGHQKMLGRPIRVSPHRFMDDIPAYKSDGGPSDCAALACLNFLEKKPDLIVSGINPTANLGLDMTYSGTVTSALEATVWGIKGIAFSLNAEHIIPEEIDFSAAEKIIPMVVEMVMTHDLPPFTILNVNIPYLPLNEIKGYKVTKGGERIYRDQLIRCIDPFGKPYYWFGGPPPESGKDPGTDSGELANSFISINPVKLDMTAYELIESVNDWNWKL